MLQAQTHNQATEHQDMLQAAASGFVARHQGEHLDDQALFDRTVAHLIAVFQVNRTTAENMAARASAPAPHTVPGFGLDSMAKEAINFMQRMDPATLATVMCHSTAQYLKGLFDISLEAAQDAAAVAFARLRPSHLYHDVSRSDAQLVMLRDPERGVTYAVPVSFIVHHVIQNPARHTLHLVN